MKFGRFPITEAHGVILAHTLRAAGVMKKGHVLSEADTRALQSEGVQFVIGARLEPNDVSEDLAAEEIAKKLAGRGLKISEARTGRCNLLSADDGVLMIDAATINAANQINEAITIATLPDKQAVCAGQIVATIKIIPFATTMEVLAQAVTVLAHRPPYVVPYQKKKFALISTVTPGLKDSVVASTEEMTRRRIEVLSGTLIGSVRVAHESPAVAEEVRRALGKGAEVVLIVGASATSDRADVIPAGILEAGGSIDHFGMPVDPGNLLLLSHVGERPVIVMPGCARSPKSNGVDKVLQRLTADLPVGPLDIMEMGVGGLLVDTPVRPLPRARAVETHEAAPPTIAAIVLAAGQSQRMGPKNKLLEDVAGTPLVRRAVMAAVASSAGQVVVVTGHQGQDVRAALNDLDVTFVHNPNYAQGLSTSLKAGLNHLSPQVAGAVICLGDMPGITASHIDRLISEFAPDHDRAIGVPVHSGKRGNPVLWGRHFFKDMCQIAGDVGARHLVGANESLVYEVNFDDTAALIDLDTPGQWEDYLSKTSPPRSR